MTVAASAVVRSGVAGAVDTVVRSGVAGAVDTVVRSGVAGAVDTVVRSGVAGAVDTVVRSGVAGAVDTVVDKRAKEIGPDCQIVAKASHKPKKFAIFFIIIVMYFVIVLLLLKRSFNNNVDGALLPSPNTTCVHPPLHPTNKTSIILEGLVEFLMLVVQPSSSSSSLSVCLSLWE